MGKKEVFTRIDEDLYKAIKSKGYKFSELIKLGYEYKEKKDKIVNEDYIKSILNELKEISKDIKTQAMMPRYVKEKIEEIKVYIAQSKSKISSRFWPSKYDMINILDQIEKKLDSIYNYLKIL